MKCFCVTLIHLLRWALVMVHFSICDFLVLRFLVRGSIIYLIIPASLLPLFKLSLSHPPVSHINIYIKYFKLIYECILNISLIYKYLISHIDTYITCSLSLYIHTRICIHTNIKYSYRYMYCILQVFYLSLLFVFSSLNSVF